VVWRKWGTVGWNRMCICSDHGCLRSHSNSDETGSSENRVSSHTLAALEMGCVQKRLPCTMHTSCGYGPQTENLSTLNFFLSKETTYMSVFRQNS
jgi:hypothetical protein